MLSTLRLPSLDVSLPPPLSPRTRRELSESSDTAGRTAGSQLVLTSLGVSPAIPGRYRRSATRQETGIVARKHHDFILETRAFNISTRTTLPAPFCPKGHSRDQSMAGWHVPPPGGGVSSVPVTPCSLTS